MADNQLQGIQTLLGRPWPEAESMLKKAEIPYTTEMMRPTKHFFQVDEQRLFVVRVRQTGLPSLQVLLAAKMVPKEG